MESSQTVEIPHPDRPGQAFVGYLVMPNKLPAPGMLLLHEAYGLNENIRDLTRRFAEAGYAAMAADLFSDGNRMVCMFRSFYGLLAAPLQNGTAKNVRAAFEYLQGRDGVDARRVGAIGFCLGGSYALQLACLDDRVRAVSVVSGQNPRPLDALKRACPIVGSYADPDFVTKDARRLDTALDEYGIPHDIKIYPGAKHSLLNDTKEGYDPQVAADAWGRTIAFFQEHLLS